MNRKGGECSGRGLFCGRGAEKLVLAALHSVWFACHPTTTRTLSATRGAEGQMAAYLGRQIVAAVAVVFVVAVVVAS